MSFLRLIATLFFTLGVLFMLGCGSARETTNAYTKARPAADEAATLMTLKTIANAQQTYFARTGGAYGTFDQLAESGALDGRFRGARPVVNGYAFTMRVATSPADKPAAYSLNADPAADPQASGARHYFMDGAGAIHYNESQAAVATDPVLP